MVTEAGVASPSNVTFKYALWLEMIVVVPLISAVNGSSTKMLVVEAVNPELRSQLSALVTLTNVKMLLAVAPVSSAMPELISNKVPEVTLFSVNCTPLKE